MDAVEYLKQLKRMCKGKQCNECPLRKTIYAVRPCVPYELEDEKMTVEIVEKWAKEHPVKTRQDEFMKMFPNVHTYNGVIDIAPCTIDKSIYGTKCIHSCDECTRKYWTEEIE